MRPRWSKKTDQLVHDIAHTCQPSLQSELGRWMHTRPRFAEFASTYQAKIRKKFTTAVDREVRLDVRAELLVAYLVLGDDRFTVAFEAVPSRAGPDLSLRYRVNQPLNLEVTRLRSAADPLTLTSTVATKARQLPTGVPNGLVIAGDSLGIDADLVTSAFKQLKSRDDAFFARRGLCDARDFHAHFLRLSSVFILDESIAPLHVRNPEARHPIPPDLLTHLLACLDSVTQPPRAAAAGYTAP